MCTIFDPDDPKNQTCKTCDVPWYKICKLEVILKIKKPPIHCGTSFGYIKKKEE